MNAIHVDEWIYRFIDFCSNYNQVKSWKILIKFYFLLSIGIYEKIEIFGVIKNFISQFNIKKACLHENKKKITPMNLFFDVTPTFIFNKREEYKKLALMIENKTHKIKRLFWSTYDYARLLVGLDLHGRSFHNIYSDIRFCFLGVCSPRKLIDASIRFEKKSDNEKNQINALKILFNAEFIDVETIMKIYESIYGLVVDLELLDQIFKYIKGVGLKIDGKNITQIETFERFYNKEKLSDNLENFIPKIESIFNSESLNSDHGLITSNIEKIDESYDSFDYSDKKVITEDKESHINEKDDKKGEEEVTEINYHNNILFLPNEISKMESHHIAEDLKNVQCPAVSTTKSSSNIETIEEAVDVLDNEDILEKAHSDGHDEFQTRDCIHLKIQKYFSTISTGSKNDNISSGKLRCKLWNYKKRPSLNEIQRVLEELVDNGVLKKIKVRGDLYNYTLNN